MYKIKFIDNSGDTETYSFFSENEKTLLSDLEETLYIVWELSPIDRNWKEILRMGIGTTFTYCDEMFLVSRAGDKEFEVQEF